MPQVYLEAMLETGTVEREEYDKTLVQIYLEEALVNEKEQGALHNLAAKVESLDISVLIASLGVVDAGGTL